MVTGSCHFDYGVDVINGPSPSNNSEPLIIPLDNAKA